MQAYEAFNDTLQMAVRFSLKLVCFLGVSLSLSSPANRNISNLLGPNSLEFDEFDPWRMVSPVQLILVIPTCEVN